VDWIDWARALFALIATLALIAGAAYAARRLGMLQPGGNGPKRLKISESLMLDPRRRLVLVRCDEREHLILLGPGGDVVVSDMPAADASEIPALRVVENKS
jgi:flagellar protein FliO/FliZ